MAKQEESFGELSINKIEPVQTLVTFLTGTDEQ
jgi:hypothetical protein